MDSRKRLLKGSKSRDIFKQLHKRKLGSGFYASDLDLCLISKHPPRIVAFLDYKRPNDSVSFAEGILYNELSKIAPVYIVEAPLIDNDIIGPFTIRCISHINWKPEPPEVYYYDEYPFGEDVYICQDWAEFKDWEKRLRKSYANGVTND